MSAIKDIYDIFTKIASEMEARRLHERKERSREEAIAYATSLEESVSELKKVVSDLEREHADEVTEVKSGHAKEVADLKTQIAHLQASNVRSSGKRPIRNWK